MNRGRHRTQFLTGPAKTTFQIDIIGQQDMKHSSAQLQSKRRCRTNLATDRFRFSVIGVLSGMLPFAQAAPLVGDAASKYSSSLECGMSETENNITALLRVASSGDRADVDALMAAIYDDLHRIAAEQLRSERRNHTLQPTALVHEAYLKLIDQHSTNWQDRTHFFRIAARVIRRILVDHARQKHTAKRGGKLNHIQLEIHDLQSPIEDRVLVELDQALEQLKAIDDRQASIVEMRFFGGLTLDEIAEALSIGRRSVDREWKAAKGLAAVSIDGAGRGRQCMTSWPNRSMN